MPSLNKNTFFVFAGSIIFSILFLTACDVIKTISTPEYSATSMNQAWSIMLEKWEIADDLKGTESALQYNGDITEIQINESPSDGNTFLLVELTIEKQKSGASSFVWKDLFVLDEQGKTYFRHPNDTFLDNYNFPRIKSTDLTIGKNKGFICFEIPKSITNDKLFLVYESPEGVVQIPLK